MSAIPAAPAVYSWPADVLAFATSQQVRPFLDPLLDATRRLFPAAQIKVLLETDPEFTGETHILFEVEIPSAAISNYVKAQHFWIDELYRVCPAPLVLLFRLALIPVAA